MTKKGIDLVDIYAGNEQVLTGTARIAQQNREQAAIEADKLEKARRSRKLEQELALINAQIESLKAQALAATQEADFINIAEAVKLETTARDSNAMSKRRDLAKRDR
jgi:circadian clock protein KaiC